MNYSLHVPPETIAAIREEFKRHVVKYDHHRFPKRPPKVDDKNRCRGCHGPLGPGRSAWCSNGCYRRYCPQIVCVETRKRDQHICQGCGSNIKEMVKAWKLEEPSDLSLEFARECWNRGVRPWETPEYEKLQVDKQMWAARKPKEEYDHIIPFSEGGLTILENMRTLCSPCHKTRTRQWHAERKMKKAA